MVERRIKEARFPTVKSLDSFEFAAIPSLNKTLVLELARCEYVARRENVIAVGNSGTGMSNSAEAEPGISAQSGPTPAVEERSSPESMEGTRARRAVPSQATERRAWGGAVDPRGRSAMGSDRGVRCGF